jgi:hypothetical protein
MRMLRWLLAVAPVVTLSTLGFTTLGMAQSTKENAKPATKVYAYYKKASPRVAKSVPSIGGSANDEPRYGTHEWWHMKTERYSSGAAP